MNTYLLRLLASALLITSLITNAYALTFDQSDNSDWDSWIIENETVSWCGMNCMAFTTNDDIMWMDKNSVQGGGNQNMGNGNDILGLFTAWIPNPNTTLNVNGDSGDDLVFINKNRGNYSLNNFVVNGSLISTQITAASSNKGNIVVNNIEALCFADGCFGSVPVMPSPVPLPAGIYLLLSGFAGLAVVRLKRSK